MAVWSQLEVDKAHVAYAIISVCSLLFAAVSLIFKERLFLGEATVSSIAGVITGPKVLNWFNPFEWSSNTNYLIQEVSRIILIIQIFAVSVELPPKYMKLHLRSVSTLLFFGMVFGWLVTALFIYVIFPRLNFADALLISGCVTATDPVLAAAIVGKGKFGERVPAHLKNLLSAESGANDGMAFPFVLLATQLVVRYGHSGEIVKNWILVSVLYECVFGTILGATIGYTGRKLIKFCESKNLIDRESFLVFYILLSLMCTGFGSLLGADDLLVSFAAGAAFAWDGWFQKKTEDSNLSNIVDLLLNMCYFLFFGAIIPWSDYNNKEMGLDIWRFILLGIVVICFRRIPIFMALKPFVPDLRSWKEAFFCGHFGPIGVGGIFCSMIAISSVESNYTSEETPTAVWSEQHAYLVRVLWPIVTFMVVTSILIHGSSVTAIVFTNHVKQMKFSVKEPRIGRADSSTELTLFNEGTDEGTSEARLKKRVVKKVEDKPELRDSNISPIEIQLDENGNIRRPEFVYVQGNRTIVEDHNGEVIDEFEYNRESNNDQRTFIQKLKSLTELTSNENYDINVDEKNSKKLKSLHRLILSAYQSGREIFIEDEDGEIIRRYIINERTDEENQEPEIIPAEASINNHHTSRYDEQDIRNGLKNFI